MSNEAETPEIQRRGLMLVLSSPSGAGKTTLSRQLLTNDSQIQLSVSCTTRARRPGEKDGVDYRFIDAASFRGMIDRGDFLEHASRLAPDVDVRVLEPGDILDLDGDTSPMVPVAHEHA